MPERGVLFGAWVSPTTGWLRSDYKRAARGFEATLGRELDISQTYVPERQSLGWKPAWDVSKERIPLISWHGLNSVEVVRGRFDDYITQFAASVKALRAPVFLSYGREMDGDASKQWVVSAADFVAAWRHIHRLFEGIPVAWVWAPNASAFGGARGGAAQYYPGDRYVDWIAADGYNWAACRGERWEEFQQIFASFHEWGSERRKPLMVSETGSVEDPHDPTRKAAWFERARLALKTSMPNIKAFVYFNSDRKCSWSVESSEASMLAFARLARDPYFDPPTAMLEGDE